MCKKRLICLWLLFSFFVSASEQCAMRSFNLSAYVEDQNITLGVRTDGTYVSDVDFQIHKQATIDNLEIIISQDCTRFYVPITMPTDLLLTSLVHMIIDLHAQNDCLKKEQNLNIAELQQAHDVLQKVLKERDFLRHRVETLEEKIPMSGVLKKVERELEHLRDQYIRLEAQYQLAQGKIVQLKQQHALFEGLKTDMRAYNFSDMMRKIMTGR